MRSVARRSSSLIPLLLVALAGCAKARPDTTPATAGAARPAGERVVRASRAAPADAAAMAASAIPASPAVARFRAEAAAALADPSVNAIWGVEVQSLDTGEVLFAQNAHALMMPASNMKVVTMSVAATHLGWDYRFKTDISATGPIANGTLDGDLVITGSGDPTISDRGGPATRVFDSWADKLRAAGITRITGRIIGDDDRFDDRPIGEGWAWDDMVGQYSAAGGALQFNENIVRLLISPGAAAGQPATIRLDPEGADLVIRSAVTTGPESSGVDITLARERNERTLYVTGSLPVGAKEITRSAAVDNPTAFFVNALRATLIRKGIAVSGPAVDIDFVTPASARDASTRRLLFTHASPPLSEIGTTFMKVSQNLFGETLMTVLGERALAAEVAKASAGTAAVAGAAAGAVAGAAASAATSAAANSADAAGMPVRHQHIEMARKLYEQTLAGWGVGRNEYVIADGSGLSRYNYLTPHMLVRILRRMARDAALGPAFEATLPIGGKDGTLGPRMKGTKSENNVRAKTGSLAGVRALSGYVRTADGERMVFSILTNNFNAPTAAVDAIADQLLERLANFTRQP